MFERILVVCVGNICRSPTGQAQLAKLLPHKRIDSAGIAVARSGLSDKPMDATAQEVAADNGLVVKDHHAKQLTQEMCHEFDLILVMEKGHIEAICSQYPQVRGKVMLFGQWLDKKEIPDPYKKSREAFEHVFELIQDAAQAWASKLK